MDDKCITFRRIAEGLYINNGKETVMKIVERGYEDRDLPWVAEWKVLLFGGTFSGWQSKRFRTMSEARTHLKGLK